MAELFYSDPYLRECETQVLHHDEAGLVLSDTLCYPIGGGQPGDTGTLRLADGRAWPILDTRRDRETREILHRLPADAPRLAAGTVVTVALDWERRHRHMRMHTGLHLLGSLIPVGEALKDTGTAALMADGLTTVAAHLSGPLAVGLILVVSMLVTPFLHHAAAVVVMGPVAAAVARPLTERARYTRRAATSQTAASAVGPLSGRRPIAPGRGTRR